MATWHGPPPDSRRRREIGAIRGVLGTARVAARDGRDTPPDDGRLVRTSTLPAAEAASHLARWEAAGGARPLDAPAGVAAPEREVADRVEPGARRLQRIAVAPAGAGAAQVAHWSVPVPATAADERAWGRVLDRLTGGGGPGGWAA